MCAVHCILSLCSQSLACHHLRSFLCSRQATVLWRYGVTLASEPDAASEQLALILEIELTQDEFCRGLCRVAILHHAAHYAALAAELAPAAEDVGSPAAEESGVAPAGAPAADATDAGPPPTPAASAPLAEVVEFFFEHRLLPRWEEWRLEQQIKAMEIWPLSEQPAPELGAAEQP